MPSWSVRLLAVGDVGCGKKTLFKALSGKDDNQEVMELVISRFILNGVQVDLSSICIPDPTDAQTEQDYMKELQSGFYPHADVFLLCFSFDSRVSLKNIRDKWIPSVQRICPGAPLVLVGNKVDLRDQSSQEDCQYNKKKFVDKQDGDTTAEIIQPYSYITCSAKNNDNVSLVFETAARAALEKAMKGKRCNIM